MGDVLDAFERAYGTREKAYESLVELRDGRTRAVLGPLGWQEPAPSDDQRS
jgi:ketoreductase RED1